MACHENIVGGVCGRILGGHIFGCQVGVIAGKVTFPFLPYGENTYSNVRNRTGKGQRQKFEVLLFAVEKNNIFHNNECIKIDQR